MELIDRVHVLIAQIRTEYAPDLRLAIFEIAAAAEDGELVLVGSTSEPAAAEALHRRVALLDAGVRVRDEVVRLPLAGDGGPTQALVTAAVAPMLAGPVVSEAHVSQTVLGHRLVVLRERGRWLHCRSHDGYLGWVHRGYVRRVDDREARAWETGTAGEASVSLGARAMVDGEVLAPLPWGSRVVRVDRSTVRLPDGALAELDGEVVARAEMAARFPTDGEAIVGTASGWIGSPYLWSGITPAGVDCSGLVQAVFRAHGVELPRDSDLQALVGTKVEPGADFSSLAAGDLLFFAEDGRRVSHVAISRGGSAIIHSSLGNGGVRRNDLNGPLPYEVELRELFVGARRVIPPADQR